MRHARQHRFSLLTEKLEARNYGIALLLTQTTLALAAIQTRTTRLYPCHPPINMSSTRELWQDWLQQLDVPSFAAVASTARQTWQDSWKAIRGLSTLVWLLGKPCLLLVYYGLQSLARWIRSWPVLATSRALAEAFFRWQSSLSTQQVGIEASVLILSFLLWRYRSVWARRAQQMRVWVDRRQRQWQKVRILLSRPVGAPTTPGYFCTIYSIYTARLDY